MNKLLETALCTTEGPMLRVGPVPIILELSALIPHRPKALEEPPVGRISSWKKR